jgi:putative addiction module CopG family antidote
MTIHLPEDLERYVEGLVHSGRFASEDDAIATALRLLQQLRPAGTPTAAKALSEEELDRRLVQAGFLGTVPSRPAVPAPRKFVPVTVQGEPLSETVIRERR